MCLPEGALPPDLGVDFYAVERLCKRFVESLPPKEAIESSSLTSIDSKVVVLYIQLLKWSVEHWQPLWAESRSLQVS